MRPAPNASRPLATVAGVMLWFWLSIFATLAGAELNAVLEMQQAERMKRIIESVR